MRHNVGRRHAENLQHVRATYPATGISLLHLRSIPVRGAAWPEHAFILQPLVIHPVDDFGPSVSVVPIS